MTVLSRANGSSITYTAVELASLLTTLEASNNTHTVASGVAFVRIGPLQLLLLDVDALSCRKLFETYAIHYDATNAFNLKFSAANINFNLDGALSAVWYNGLTPVTQLSSIHAATYVVAKATPYIEAHNLVKDQRNFGVEAAEIKTLVGGQGCTLAESLDSIVVNIDPIGVEFQPYGNAALATSPYADHTFHDYSNHALVAVQPLYMSTASLGPGTAGNNFTPDDLRVTHLNVDAYSKGEMDNRLASASFSNYGVSSSTNYSDITVHSSTNVLSFMAPFTFTTVTYNDVSLVGTPMSSVNVSHIGLDTSVIQTMIDASIQTALNSITFDDSFTVDRSVPGALAISAAAPAVTILSQAIEEVDVPTSGSDHWIIGSGLADINVDGLSWTFVIDMWFEN